LYFSVNPIIVKPMQTGQELDTIFYQQCDIPQKNIFNFYSLDIEASLHTAGNLTNQKIDLQSLLDQSKSLLSENRPKIFELAGGILSPINDKETMLDFVKLLKLPIILVV
ncbi:ATP-dependent dethiobiotin synthetase BioD, partial [Enterococcus cecorum]